MNGGKCIFKFTKSRHLIPAWPDFIQADIHGFFWVTVESISVAGSLDWRMCIVTRHTHYCRCMQNNEYGSQETVRLIPETEIQTREETCAVREEEEEEKEEDYKYIDCEQIHAKQLPPDLPGM